MTIILFRPFFSQISVYFCKESDIRFSFIGTMRQEVKLNHRGWEAQNMIMKWHAHFFSHNFFFSKNGQSPTSNTLKKRLTSINDQILKDVVYVVNRIVSPKLNKFNTANHIFGLFSSNMHGWAHITIQSSTLSLFVSKFRIFV